MLTELTEMDIFLASLMSLILFILYITFLYRVNKKAIAYEEKEKDEGRLNKYSKILLSSIVSMIFVFLYIFTIDDLFVRISLFLPSLTGLMCAFYILFYNEK